MEWYYANENDEQIPVSEDELAQLARSGVVKPTTLVWNESLPDWSECQSLKPALFQTSAPADSRPTFGSAVKGGGEFSPIANESYPVQTVPGPDEPPPLAGVPQVQGPADGLAVASLVCGIIGIVVSLCSWGFGIPVSIAAAVMGHIGRKKLREAQLPIENSKLTAGLIMGWIGVGFGILMIIGFILYMVLMVGAAASSGL